MNPVYKFISLCSVAGFCVMLSTAESSLSLAEDKPPTEKQDAVLDTIAQINHINWVVNKELIVIDAYPGVATLDMLAKRTSRKRFRTLATTASSSLIRRRCLSFDGFALLTKTEI